MLYNQPDGDMFTLKGAKLRKVDDFIQLGSWIQSCQKYAELHMHGGLSIGKIWKSNLQKRLKIQFFRATVESVLLYGAESWTLTKKMRDRLDGNYTKMLRVVLNVSRKEHKTNKELYGNLRKVTETLRARRLKFIGNSWRRKTELISKVLLWDQRERRKDHQLHTYTS